MSCPARIELSRKALRGNLRFLGRELGSSSRMSLVVKGNAYGHGIEIFVPLARECGVGHFSVFSSDEAMRVLNASGGDCELMIMGYMAPDQIDWAVGNDISFFVFDPERLEAALQASKRVGRPARVHLHLETGMNRLGLDLDQLKACAARILDAP